MKYFDIFTELSIVMGDSLEISSNNAVNGITHSTDDDCLNSGDGDHCMSVMPSGDLLMMKKMDDSDAKEDTDTGENGEPVPPPIIASSLGNSEHEDCLNSGDGDHCMSVMPSGDLQVMKKMDDSDARDDTNAEENGELVPPSIAASSLGNNEYEDYYLNLEVENCASDNAGSSSSRDSDSSRSVSDKHQPDAVSDSGCEGNEANKHSLNQASDPDCIATSSSSCAEIQNSAASGNVESQHIVQDDPSSLQKCASRVASDTESAVSEMENSSDLLVMKKTDDIHMRDDANTGENEEPLPPPIASSPLGNNEHEVYLNLEVENCVNDDAGSNSSHDSDSSHSVSDKHQPDAVSDSGCEGNEANKHGLNQASDPDCIATSSSSCAEIQNFTAGSGNVESQHTIHDNPSSLQKPASLATSDTEIAAPYIEAEELPASKCDENHHTNELQLECEDDELKTVSGGAESEKPDDRVTCEATDEKSKISSSLPTSQVSAAGVVTLSATSMSTTAAIPVVIRTPLLSTLTVSRMPVSVSVRPVTSGSGVIPVRPTQQSDKSLALSAPSATVSSSTTRLMSKLLQDVGLLLVSQRVFKNLASIQRQKIGGSEKKSDMELLQKLKTSHQNLVAKNHGLLLVERKCWCGFRSESRNVVENHRLKCDFQGRCCYCQGEFVYRTQNQMKRHLWKAHRKVGHAVDRYGSYICIFCPLDFSSRLSLIRHMDVCRRSFWLTSNLAPTENDKDIPVSTALKQPVQIPVVVSSAQISPATTTLNLSGNTPVPRAMNLQFASAPRNPGPVTQLFQIGKQLFTLLPSTTVSGPAVAVNSAIKSVGKMALNSAIQTAQSANSALPIVFSKVNSSIQTTQNANSALPIVVSNRSTNQAASRAVTVPQAVTMPAPVLQSGIHYTVCTVCGALVKDKTALLIHMHIAHGSTHKMCQYCCSPDITFPSLTELHIHIAKFHTSDCWICKIRFQPPDQLVNHVAVRHKVTMSKMLELRRCYLCSSVPSLSKYAGFEEHMMKMHSLQFSDTGKLWDHIVNSPNVDKNWYAKRNPDGTLECPHCSGQFISASFLYRHLHLEHDGNVIRITHCRECGKSMQSNILPVHLIAAHTRKCSVRLTQLDVPDHGCIFIPPVGTKRIKNTKGQRVSSCPPIKRVKVAETVVTSCPPVKPVKVAETVVTSCLPVKRVKVAETVVTTCPPVKRVKVAETVVISCPPIKRVKVAETVVISDDDESDSEDYHDDSSDEDFMSPSHINVQPTERLLRSTRSSTSRRNSSVDDVHEVLESIVDSSESETVAKRSIRFANTPICPAPGGPAAAAQLCNGITEDEVEIIESIVQKPLSEAEHSKPSDRVADSAVTDTTASAKSAPGVCATSEQATVELAEHLDGDCRQPAMKPVSASAESSAQHLMERDQIMMNSVEEVMEVDGETIVIVHDDDNGGDDDDDNEGD